MHLQQLTILNFKNYAQSDLTFDDKINCFVGNNGTGKTNLLDAIYYLSFTKSYFNSIDSQIIKHDEAMMMLQGQYLRDQLIENIYVGLKKGQKKIVKRNDESYDKLSEHIGLLPLVMISPNDSRLIIGGSEERRKFMDSVIAQYNKDYLNKLLNYNRILQQRNQSLKAAHRNGFIDRTMLEVYNKQLSDYGTAIYEERLRFLDQLLPVFQQYYKHIAQDHEQVEMHYHSQLHKKTLPKLLVEYHERDQVLQYTSCGIHKDDLLLRLDQHPMKKVGSQGQQKSYLIALKLAQFDIIKQINGFKPILLLDDIFDKLDDQRVRQIVEIVADQHFGQIFITDAHPDRIANILSQIQSSHNIYKINNGQVESIIKD